MARSAAHAALYIACFLFFGFVCGTRRRNNSHRTGACRVVKWAGSCWPPLSIIKADEANRAQQSVSLRPPHAPMFTLLLSEASARSRLLLRKEWRRVSRTLQRATPEAPGPQPPGRQDPACTKRCAC